MDKVIIIDYKMGNLYSIANACEKVGLEVEISSDPSKIKSAKALILPGVGAYPLAVKHLNENRLASYITDFVKTGKKVFGICLGMQLLMEQSDEFGLNKGLGIITGEVLRFPENSDPTKTRHIPQITWNNVQIEIPNHPLFKGIRNNEYFYFVHSNYVEPKQKENILCTTEYAGFTYASAVVKENVYGIQFHPEKSGIQGLRIFENFKYLI
jgi:glutamine amidotransferase